MPPDTLARSCGLGSPRATANTWSSCSNESGTLVPVKGVRTLTPEEAALFEAHVQAAAYHEGDPRECAYDGPLFAMSVIAGAGEQLYVDDNVNCYTDGRRVAPDVRPLASELWQKENAAEKLLENLPGLVSLERTASASRAVATISGCSRVTGLHTQSD